MRKKILVIDEANSELRSKNSMLQSDLQFVSIDSVHPLEVVKQIGVNPQLNLILLELSNESTLHLQLIREIKSHHPQLPLIVLIAYVHDADAAKLIEAGADDYLTKPFTLVRLRHSIHTALRMQHISKALAGFERGMARQIRFHDLIGRSALMKEVLMHAEAAVHSPVPVWIQGEEGTGKEFLARAIHGQSQPAGKHFVSLACESLNGAGLVSATEDDASIARLGEALQDANCGTLYLDEIGALPLPHQYRLLDVIESGVWMDAKTRQATPLQFRLICSSKRNQAEFFNEGFYLLYKKFQTSITLPPLRERPQDIAVLADHFIQLHCGFEKKHIAGLSADALHDLERQSWYGNLTELKSLLHRAVLLCAHEELDLGTLRLVRQLQPVHYASALAKADGMPTVIDMEGHIKKLKSIEEEVIRYALYSSGGSMTRAARKLGIGRSTLYRKLNGMEPELQMARPNHTTRPMMEVSASKHS